MMQTLFTSEGENLKGTPWEEYPRPQLRRKEWLCLNGTWELSVDDGDASTIRVPFCPESILSQYQGQIKYGSVMLYRKSFQIPKDYLWKCLLLHFGAVSNVCDVFVNGRKVCTHENGYLSFTADITHAMRRMVF